jgi:hypothetical protein
VKTVYPRQIALFSALADLFFIVISIWTNAWQYDQGRLFLSLGILLSSAFLISSLIRWYRYGAKYEVGE